MATDALLPVKLLDVTTRQIVQYPGTGCEYTALSYVWGKVGHERFAQGDKVKTLAKTLEDAITLTGKLGKRYIWIDSICINQNDPEDVADQVDRMWSIYRGAWLTIIALSGASADAVSSSSDNRSIPIQIRFKVQDKTVVSLFPTLSTQIWTSSWVQRAWTLQEGLLSARCLYVTAQQMYFDCASMQCSESLEETRSWAHNLTPASNPTQEGFVTWMLRQAGAGALRIPLDWPSRRLEYWGTKLNLYSCRDMTYQTDAIRAFSGILQRLLTIYPKGFFWGLPYEDFDWALTWAASATVSRREGFPSWSWAGWKGVVFFGQPLDVTQTRRTPTWLQISRFEAGNLVPVYTSVPADPTNHSGDRIVILNDPVHSTWEGPLEDTRTEPAVLQNAEEKGFLSVTAVCLHFAPDFSNPQTRTYAQGQLQRFAFKVDNTSCLIRIYSMDDQVSGSWIDEEWECEASDTKHTFVLLARDHVTVSSCISSCGLNGLDRARRSELQYSNCWCR
ncbi:uncharacterized protein AB675_9647 [Cyphellophora attinorum]|uniref:Heterokaryon incompatibility domain-containing protein n=1 Tax=Cyphellophora attinorum TaxID=1664694 RepID=A0A0N1HWV3_9EURO|nr:uncharacterized protein AB675_9647 [Phialophora attinorum]KPI42245.1 hypothetical protein AB675_9647 [Phialophora attinorum]